MNHLVVNDVKISLVKTSLCSLNGLPAQRLCHTECASANSVAGVGDA